MTVLQWVAISVGVWLLLSFFAIMVWIVLQWWHGRGRRESDSKTVASPYGSLPTPTNRELLDTRQVHLSEEVREFHLREELRKMHSNHPWR